MNKHLVFFTVMMALGLQLFAQGGMWTWMRGDGNTSLSVGNYGTQGVTAATNEPPARYNPSSWQDTAGHFWIFGGFRNNGTNFTDLWKYEPDLNVWTWMKGNMNGAGAAGNFGTQGISAPTNNPPSNSLTSVSWSDTADNLWLYHKFGDLWRYNITTNEWTWMKGSGVAAQPAVYGTQGVPSPTNTPGSNIENKAAWTDSNNHLWLYNKGNMWMYDIPSNQWTWIKGNGATNTANFGTMGVPDPTVQPEQNDSYIQWKDRDDNFYIATNGYPGTSSTIWKYHTDINQWEWHSGDSALNTGNQNRNFISQCASSIDRDPGKRLEARGINYLDHAICSGDSIFWFHGGAHAITGGTQNNNDLWIYNRFNQTWKWVSGDSTLNTIGNYGTQGIPSLTTMPYAMNGHAMWVDKEQQVWVWGGKSDVAVNNNNMWRFTPDTNCIKWTPNQFAVLPQQSNVTMCIGDSLTIAVNPNQTYQVTPANGYYVNASNSTISFFPSSTTTYTIQANSNVNCVAPVQLVFTVSIFTPPTFTVPSNDTICIGQSSTLSVSNPPTGMQFLWLPGNLNGSSISVSPTSTTTYTLVSSYSSCTHDTNTVQVEVTNLSWNNVNTTNCTCFGLTNGTIQVSATSIGSINYTLFPGGANNTSGAFSGLAAGNYTVNVSNGYCGITTTLQISQPSNLVQNSLSSTLPSCTATTGGIQTLYSGGSGTITYTLQPSGLNNTTGAFSNLGQGTYTILVSDANSCTTSTSISLLLPSSVQIQNIQVTPSGCNGNNNGSAVVTASGSSTPFQYSIGSNFQSSSQFTNLAAGGYTLVVKDTNSCIDTATFIILTKNPPTINSVNVQQPVCPADPDGAIVVQAFSDTSIASFNLQPGNLSQSNGSFTNLTPGSYTITVMDASGCTAITIAVLLDPPGITVNLSQIINKVCQVTESGSVQSNAVGGNPPLTYTLLPPGISNTTGFFDQLLPGKYQIVVTDSKNCKQGDSVEILNIPCCTDVEIPNAFSPNADQLNDELRILNVDQVVILKFVIANRWGNIVFETNELKNWDGTLDGAAAAADTYYYFLKYKCLQDGNEYMKKGDVILLR